MNERGSSTPGSTTGAGGLFKEEPDLRIRRASEPTEGGGGGGGPGSTASEAAGGEQKFTLRDFRDSREDLASRISNSSPQSAVDRNTGAILVEKQERDRYMVKNQLRPSIGILRLSLL